MTTEACGSVWINQGMPTYCMKPKGHDYGHSFEAPSREEIREIVREEIEAHERRIRPFGIGSL